MHPTNKKPGQNVNSMTLILWRRGRRYRCGYYPILLLLYIAENVVGKISL
jgi:hypothetical protein